MSYSTATDDDVRAALEIAEHNDAAPDDGDYSLTKFDPIANTLRRMSPVRRLSHKSACKLLRVKSSTLTAARRAGELGCPRTKAGQLYTASELLGFHLRKNRPENTSRRGIGVVYFVGGDQVGMVKIGRSFSAEGRLQDLQIGSPVRLRIMATLPGGRHRERELHREFSAYHSHGEWFRLEGALREFIADLVVAR
jgi:hypothetical protein